MYGKIDATARASTVGTSGATSTADLTKYSVDSAGLSGSRFGFKGSEDLGGGLKASFQVENGFNVDSGAAAQGGLLFGRQAYVSLGGGFGSISVGRQYGTYDNALGSLDIQGYSTNSAMGYAFAGFLPSATATSGAHADAFDGSGRVNNAIVYTTPSISGFSASLMYAPGENNVAATAATATALAVTAKGATAYTGFMASYAAGPLMVMGAYEQQGTQATDATGPTLSLVGPTGTCAATQTLSGSICSTPGKVAAGSATTSGGILGVTYDLTAVKLSGTIGNGKTTAKSDFGYAIGAAVPMGAAVIQVGWASETMSADNKVDGTADAFGTTVVYTLSKRTNVYGSFIRSNLTPTAATVAAQTKTTIATYGVGVRHDF